jgi:DNA-directed RNA polymerase III subunit RPC2
VDRVLLTANETDQFLVKVMVRQSRRPEIGDKLATGVRKKNKIGLS